MTIVLTDAICRCDSCGKESPAVLSDDGYQTYMRYAEAPNQWYSFSLWVKDPDAPDAIRNAQAGDYCSLKCVEDAIANLRMQAG